MSSFNKLLRPDKVFLLNGFYRKYGENNELGPNPRRRLKYGYYLPADLYESTVEGLVDHETRWLDVGGGKSLFPDNDSLANELSGRCKLLVAVDPSDNIFQNPFAHQKHQTLLEDWSTDQTFDLITMRMVVEHVADPIGFMQKVSELLAPGAFAYCSRSGSMLPSASSRPWCRSSFTIQSSGCFGAPKKKIPFRPITN